MLLIFGPGLLIAVAGAMLGSLVAPLASARGAARFGSWILWGVALSTSAAVFVAFSLPRHSVSGPIGATCPDTTSSSADVLTALTVASVATGIAAVASAVVEGWRRAATGATFARLAFAIVAPYLALGAWLLPMLCDYSW